MGARTGPPFIRLLIGPIKKNHSRQIIRHGGCGSSDYAQTATARAWLFTLRYLVGVAGVDAGAAGVAAADDDDDEA